MTDALPRVAVSRATLIAAIMLSSLCAGCIEVPTSARPCPENTCFPLTSGAFNELIADDGAFDVLTLASEHERLQVRSTLVQEIHGERGEMHWDVAKDELIGLRSVSTRYFVSGIPIIDTQLVDGQGVTNVRSGSGWYQGRDASPNYADPFFDLAQRAAGDPDGIWPPFYFDVSQLSGLSWTITGDALSSQQVASASNDTHDFIIELVGLSPQITAIEVYSGEDYEFTLRVSTGEQVVIELQEDLPRAHVPLIPQPPSLLGIYGDTTVLIGAIPEDFTSEAHLSEIEIHAIAGGFTTASMPLDSDEINVTSQDGTWWKIEWVDAGHRDLISTLDTYYVRTNSTAEFSVRFYDLWAESWTDQSLD